MANFQGSSAGETLVGTAGDDVIVGGGGNDRIDGGPGGDTLAGGADSDRIDGESGNDVIEGGGGTDELRGGAGDDIVHGGDGNDWIYTDEPGSDQLYGDAGNDFLEIYRHIAGSVVSVFGGSGSDTIFVGALAAGNTLRVDAGDDVDWIYLPKLLSSPVLTLGAGRDVIDGGGSNFDDFAGSAVAAQVTDWQTGVAGDMIDVAELLGGTGWNRSTNPFTAGYLKLTQSGSDVLLSLSATANGAFKDLIVFQNLSVEAFTAENFGGYSPDGTVGAAGHVIGTEAAIELLTGGSGDDLVEGGGGRDFAYGGSGSDTIRGQDGNDRLEGGTGNDELEGGEGLDVLYGGAGNDVLRGGEGNDRLEDERGDDSVYGEGGNDVIYLQRLSATPAATLFASGGDGDDSININAYNASTATVDAGAGNDSVSVNGSFVSQTVTLGSGVDLLSYSMSSSSPSGITKVTDFEAGDAGDRVRFTTPFSALGSDPFATGYLRLVQSGTDVLLQYDLNAAAAGHGWITVITFENSDVAEFTAYNLNGYSLGGPPPAGLVLAGTDGDDQLHGDGGTDLIGGEAGNDSLLGLGGDDELDGGIGNDRLDGGFGVDHLIGGEGDDVLTGGDGNDLLEGGERVDSFTGGAGDDAIFGGGGNDRIVVADSGSDSIHGGAGDDSIEVIRYNPNSETITIAGDEGRDTIRIAVQAGTVVNVDSGTGDDRVILDGGTANRITLGDGRDVVELDSGFAAGGSSFVTDFEGGDGGDSIDFSRWLTGFAATLDANANPFVAGTMRLLQSGADVLLQFDRDGTASAYGWSTLLTLKNVDMSSLRPANFDNYQLLFQHGTEGSDSLDGSSSDDVIHGEGGDDVIRGFAGADKLYGGEGADDIDGGTGADTVEGGAGDDVLAGGADADSISGGDGDDEIDGGTEADVVHGGDGNDSAAGGDGDDDLFGEGGDDTLTGGSGLDILDGGAGHDALDGGEGNDSLYFQPVGSGPDHDVVDGGAGQDVLFAEFSAIPNGAGLTMTISGDASTGYSGTLASGSDHSVAFSAVEAFFIGGTDAADVVTTGDFADLIVLDAGNDIIVAGGGSDWLIGGAGADSMTGGTGNDRYDVDDAGDVVVENAGEGSDLVEVRLASYTLLANFEHLTGLLSTGQALTGNDLANVIKGGAGNDVIDGGAGADNLQGGAGDDLYLVDDAGDSVTESSGGGTDEIRTALAVYGIAASTAVENLTGTADTGQTLTGNTLANTIRGGGGDDQLGGGTGNDVLFGGAGNDQLDGGIGNDVMRGELGDDVYTVDSATDSVIENVGEGTDKVLTALSSYTLAAYVENLTGTSVVGQTMRANALDNVVAGSAGGDSIRVQDGGADKVFGNGGGDIIYFGAAMTAADEADGGAGSDTLVLQGSYSAGLVFNPNGLVAIETLQLLSRTNTFYGGSSVSPFSYSLTTVDANVVGGALLTVDATGLAANEGLDFNGKAELDGRFAVTGGLAGDTLSGGAGADSLSGGGGNDFLDGGAGADTLTGGSGNDIYIVDNAGDVVVESPGAGTDEVRTALASYSVSPNVEVVRGTNATGQQLTGGFSGVTIIGAAGNDLLDDGGAAAALQGGLGDDIYVVRTAGSTVSETPGEGTDTVRSYASTFTISFGVEKLIGMLSTGQILVGHSGDDIIEGGGGADRLDGRGGADVLTGGLGGDFYVVDTLADTVIEAAGEGIDTIETALAAFTLIANVENLTGLTNSGQTLTGNEAANIITAGAGNDLLAGLGGDDRLIGGGGSDTITYAGSAAGIVATVGPFYSGTVTVGGSETDSFESIETIVGTDLADTFVNNSTVPSSVMTFAGGAGDDLYRVGSTADVIVEQAGGGIDHVFTAASSYQLGANLEKLTGTAATAQTLFGNALDNVVTGGAGNDSLRLHGGGLDRAAGGAGGDSIFFGATFGAGDSVDGGEGYDVLLLKGSYSALSLGANVVGIESLELMSRSDVRFDGATGAPASYDIISQGLSAIGLFQVDGTKLAAGETLSFDGSAETDVAFALLGGAGGDVLRGGALADTLDGRGGADTMAGGAGDDVYRVDNSNDVVVEQADGGADRVLTTLASYTLGANLEGLLGLLDTGQVLTGNANGNSLVGGGGDDVLDGAGGDLDYLDGGGGDDRFLIRLLGNVGAYGGSGTDTLVIDYSAAATGVTSFFDTHPDGHWGGVRDEFGNNTVSFSGIERFDVVTGIYDDDLKTGEGDDRLVLGGGDDRGEAGGGNDRLEGGTGNDVLLGGAGDDLLDGGAGGDSLSGGAGNDLYFADSTDQVFENSGEGVDEVRTASATFALSANVEKLTATGHGAAPLLLRGNALDNVMTTEVGLALFYLQDGGDDTAYGASHGDIFYFGAAFDSGDRVEGGFGTDTVVLQGAYGPLVLTAGTMIGIQTLALLSAGDSRFGHATDGAYSYDITVSADFSSAIPTPFSLFPDEEGELLIDASRLASNESLRFDGSLADPALGHLWVKGGAGDDYLLGSAGGDALMGGGGDDLIEGGGGNDYLDDSGGASNVLRGGEGNDTLSFASYEEAGWATLSIEGGDGDDWALLYAGSAGTATLDMGAGDDRVEIRHFAGGIARVTLGAGQDVLTVNRMPFLMAGSNLGELVVADFQPGAGGDRFEWPADLAFAFDRWSPRTNPFAAGYARLVQSGSDTVLEVSPTANGIFSALVRFENATAADFTGENFGGWSPLPVTGGSGPDQLSGTASSDYLFGEGGNDFFFLQAGGEDAAHGGEGNDVLYFGTALSAGDVADGGEGRDAIVLQGNVTAVLSDTNLYGIESISIQSGANTRFGDTANNFYDYDVTTADGNVAAGQQLIVNAQSLRAGEDFTFDGSAESDGKFLVYGGHGVDDLTGGAGADVFLFEGTRWGPSDKVDGGAGRDALVISAGSGLTRIEFAADALTNIESISLNNRYATDPSQKPSYELVLHNGNVAPGGTLIVNGSSIPAGQLVNIDGRGVQHGNLILFGGGGHDTLFGGGGNDTILGGGGSDTLIGGAGADTFRYDAASDSIGGSSDMIGDFQSGTDKIDLSRIDANTHADGNQAFSWIGSNAFSGTGAASAGELRVYQSNGQQRIEGDTDGDGLADLVIVLQAGTAPVGQGDFMV
jgi:Ca2+-binding RTX toxin-like protein